MNEPEHATIHIVELERMNLLGLMLRSLLERQLHDPRAQRHFDALSGAVEIEARGMQVALAFEQDDVEIRRGGSPVRPIARIRGTLTAVLDAALGRHLLGHFLRGELSAWGKPLALWHLFALMHVRELSEGTRRP
jgi:hypothetical protein